MCVPQGQDSGRLMSYSTGSVSPNSSEFKNPTLNTVGFNKELGRRQVAPPTRR